MITYDAVCYSERGSDHANRLMIIDFSNKTNHLVTLEGTFCH